MTKISILIKFKIKIITEIITLKIKKIFTLSEKVFLILIPKIKD